MSEKIAFIATGYIKKFDGISVYTENILKELLLNDFIRNGGNTVDVYVGESVLSLLIERLNITDLNGELVHFIPVNDKNFFYKMLDLYKKIIFGTKYDLIFCTNFMPLILPKRNIVKVIHDFSPEITPSLYSTFYRFYHSLLLKSGKMFDNAIGYISQTTKSDLKKFYDVDESNKCLIYLPNGIPFKVKNYQRPSDVILEKYNVKEIDFLVVGRINRAKGFDRILEFCNYFDIFLQDENKFKRVTLHIAGKQTEETTKIFKDLKLSKIEIIFHGFIDDETLNQLYTRSHFCFFLSRNEGYGLPLVEALWFKSIPILSNIDIFNEILDEKYPKFNDRSGYKEAIKEFILKVYYDKNYFLFIQKELEDAVKRETHGYQRAAQNLIEFHISENKIKV